MRLEPYDRSSCGGRDGTRGVDRSPRGVRVGVHQVRVGTGGGTGAVQGQYRGSTGGGG